jgi:4-amino-4-deoxy-L-arabinose transferase-like glycosyltransferase
LRGGENVRIEGGAGDGALIAQIGRRTMGLEQRFSSLAGARQSPFVAVLALFSLAVLYYWNGLGAGDEIEYARAARAWLAEGPNLGQSHWALRQLLVLPMAASFSLFGFNEFAATAPNMLFALALVGVTYWFARRYIAEQEAIAISAVIATSCYFVARPIEVDIYGVEALFAVTSVWLFIASRDAARPLRWLFAAGVAGGLAFTIRETSASIAISLATLTLVFHRQRFFSAGLALGVGYCGVIAFEVAAYALASGDPLYRYKIDFGHKSVGAASTHGGGPSGFMRLLLPFKDIAMAPSLTPFVGLAVVFAGALRWRGAFEPRAAGALAAFSIAGLVALAVSAWGLKLAMPNYYPIFAYAVLVAIGVALAEAWRRHGALAAGAAFAVIVALNLLAEDFRDYDDWAEARILSAHAPQFGEPVLTDYATGARARLLLEMRGASEAEASRMITLATEPAPGALYFRAWGSGLAPAAQGETLAEFTPLRASPTREAMRKAGLGGDPQSRLGRIVGERPTAAFMRIAPHADESQ